MNYELATATIEALDLCSYEKRLLETMLTCTTSKTVKQMVEQQLTNDFETYKDEFGRTGYICNMAYGWHYDCGYSKLDVIAFAKALIKANLEVKAALVAEAQELVDMLDCMDEVKVTEHQITTGTVTKFKIVLEGYANYKGLLTVTTLKNGYEVVIHLYGAGRPLFQKIFMNKESVLTGKEQRIKALKNRLFSSDKNGLRCKHVSKTMSGIPVKSRHIAQVSRKEADKLIEKVLEQYPPLGEVERPISEDAICEYVDWVTKQEVIELSYNEVTKHFTIFIEFD